MATPIYAPLGTAMSLGDYVRVTRTFLELFKAAHLPDPAPSRDLAGQEVNGQLKDEDIVKLKEDLQVSQRPRPLYNLPSQIRTPAGVPVRVVSTADQRRSHSSSTLTSRDRVSHDAAFLLGLILVLHLARWACPVASRSHHDLLRRAQLQEDGSRLGHLGRDCTIQAYLWTGFWPVRLCGSHSPHIPYLSRDVGGGACTDVDVASVV